MGKLTTMMGDIIKGRRVIDGRKYSPIAESLSYKSISARADKLRRAGISARVMSKHERFGTWHTIYVPTRRVKEANQILKR